MARVYLETSFVSACVSERSDVQSLYRKDASLRWWRVERPRHEVIISDEVVAELSDPRYPRSNDALKFVEGVGILAVSPPMVALAEVLVDRQVMPKPVGGDALHVAMATVAKCDYVLTWNVKHLANPNKTQHLTAVCYEFGLLPPMILRPDDMMEIDDGPSQDR
jgi:hypothetical protein